jgi:hypothetical protein
MAIGDLIVFEEAKRYMLIGDILAADEVWIGLVTEACGVGDAKPAYVAGGDGITDYTPIATAGNYAAGGLLLNTLPNIITEAAGTVTFDDTDPSVTWAQDPANPVTARTAVVYNKTTGLCFLMIDLGAAIDMQAGDLTITWNGSGMFTMV